MIFKTLAISVIFFSIINYSTAQKYEKLKKGMWTANLILNSTDRLPFKLEVSGTKKNPLFTIHNAEENILLSEIKQVNDSLQIDFPNFHSYIRFVVKSKREISGKWVNLNKSNDYYIPFKAELKKSNNSYNMDKELNLSGNWKTVFSPNTKDEDLALGVFKTQENSRKLTGTFLTETGDYRFLEGYSLNNEMLLSCFDGSHAFLFKGRVKNDSIFGTFFSGKHYSTSFLAHKDSVFQLRSPDSLTYLVKKDVFEFKLKDLKGEDFSFPNKQFENKVTIIQIMGTWCPNCLDETRFLKEMYDKYHSEGLEIISVAYETPNDFKDQVEKVNLLKTRMNLDFTFLIGGQANKALSSQQFSMLNEIISYPTAIFINKKGEVIKVHTGFNGPGTGDVYKVFREETEGLIKKLLY